MVDKYDAYYSEVDNLIDLLEKDISRHPDLIESLQKKLDVLAKKYQRDTELGSDRYLLYHAQALIHYQKKEYDLVERWLSRAIKIKGQNYRDADDILKSIGSSSAPTMDFNGVTTRVNRSSFFISQLTAIVLLATLSLFWVAVLLRSNVNEGALSFISIIAYIFFILMCLWFGIYSIRISIYRFHDMGMSGWWVVACYIPLVGIILGLILLFNPGEHGTNRYGNPVQGSRLLKFWP
jgi:uncharacterized membrane protein YhaH (DUF805 family)